MDFGLKEIGITFMIGAFTILGLELVLYYLSKIVLTGFFRDRLGLVEKKEDLNTNSTNDNPANSESVQNMRLAVFIGLSFAVGILAEDISYKFVDNKLPFGLESKYDTREKVLITDFDNPQLSPLAKDLATNKAFEIIEPEKGSEIQKWILGDGNCLDCTKITNDDVRNSMIKLYYHAKNKVYLQNNYYDEMKKIQTRADFARSIAVISIFYFLITVLFSIILIIDRVFCDDYLVKKCKATTVKVLNDMESIKFTNLLCIGTILISIFIFSWWAYDNESLEYNKRAFGYFATSLKK